VQIKFQRDGEETNLRQFRKPNRTRLAVAVPFHSLQTEYHN